MPIGSSTDLILQIFPGNAVSKLEFDIIESAVLNNCISELGRKATLSNNFLIDKNQIIKKLLEVKDFQDILKSDHNFPIENYHDLEELLKLIDLPDFTILPTDIHKLNQFILTTEHVIAYLKKNREQYTKLYLLVKDFEFKINIKDKIFTICDLDGIIKSTASDKLFTLRSNISVIEHEIDKSFEKILNFCKSKEWLTEEHESVRNGERVLAFNSKFKRKIKGIIYDESITGKTTFIQPESILDMRNKWFDLKQKEKREIFIILKDFTKYIRPFLPYLLSYQQLIANIDHIRAKAKYANYLGAVMPLISEFPVINIKEGYHPVLLTKNRLAGKKTIPLDIELDEHNRILVISGPNAGGKSVCLKTVGLFQLMVQYGLPVPANENSVIGIFHKLFIDIGDDQSIENDLSTYSSRLMNQHHFIKNADAKTMFLIDEFGSGTEPATGGVIAEVLLERLNDLKSMGMVTTHYTNLKVLAGKSEGITNAAMLFDNNMLQPLYKLKIGEPGSSFALEILENIGFDNQIIRSIRERLMKDELDLHKLLLELQDKKDASDTLLQSLYNKDIELNKLLEDNINIKSELKSKKNQIITKSREDAEAYLQKLIRDFEKLVREWKESETKAKDELSGSIRKQIQISREKISNDLKASRKWNDLSQNVTLVEGDLVILKETGQKGNIIKINKDNVVVLFGNIKTVIELNRLAKADKPPQKQQSKVKSYNSSFYSVTKEVFKPVLDIRGFRRDAAIREVEIYLDKAILHDFNELRIIHGYGDGILKEAIRSMLKKYSFVKNFHSEHADHGDDGVTVIQL